MHVFLMKPSRARLTVWQQEHWTLVAPRMYIKSVWHPPQTNCAISVPALPNQLLQNSKISLTKRFYDFNGLLPGGGTAVTALQTAQQTEVAPTGYIRRFLQPEHTNWLCPLVLPTTLKLFIYFFGKNKIKFNGLLNICGINKWVSGKIIYQYGEQIENLKIFDL